MEKAVALVVIALLASEARGEAYRPLPRLPPAKVRSRAAGDASRVSVPPAADEGARPEPRPGDVRVASPRPGAPTGRRTRRVGPPPPLQDERGRVVVFASVPPLQDEAGGLLEAIEPVHVIVLPAPRKRARAGGATE